MKTVSVAEHSASICNLRHFRHFNGNAFYDHFFESHVNNGQLNETITLV
jgi:hypothetical protein